MGNAMSSASLESTLELWSTTLRQAKQHDREDVRTAREACFAGVRSRHVV